MAKVREYRDKLAEHLASYLQASGWDEICAMVNEDAESMSLAEQERLSKAVDDMSDVLVKTMLPAHRTGTYEK